MSIAKSYRKENKAPTCGQPLCKDSIHPISRLVTQLQILFYAPWLIRNSYHSQEMVLNASSMSTNATSAIF